jgi:hypothetical protein
MSFKFNPITHSYNLRKGCRDESKRQHILISRTNTKLNGENPLWSA